MNNKTVIWAVAAVVVATILGQVAITIAGKNGASLGDLLQQIGTLVAALAAAGGFTAASSAARSSEAARQQTNGSLDQRINDAVTKANSAQLAQVDALMRRHLRSAAVQPAEPQDFPSTPANSVLESGDSSVSGAAA